MVFTAPVLHVTTEGMNRNSRAVHYTEPAQPESMQTQILARKKSKYGYDELCSRYDFIQKQTVYYSQFRQTNQPVSSELSRVGKVSQYPASDTLEQATKLFEYRHGIIKPNEWLNRPKVKKPKADTKIQLSKTDTGIILLQSVDYDWDKSRQYLIDEGFSPKTATQITNRVLGKQEKVKTERKPSAAKVKGERTQQALSIALENRMIGRDYGYTHAALTRDFSQRLATLVTNKVYGKPEKTTDRLTTKKYLEAKAHLKECIDAGFSRHESYLYMLEYGVTKKMAEKVLTEVLGVAKVVNIPIEPVTDATTLSRKEHFLQVAAQAPRYTPTKRSMEHESGIGASDTNHKHAYKFVPGRFRQGALV